MLTLGNEGARRYTIAAGKTRPVAPVQVGPHGAEFRGVLVKTFNQARETRPSLPEEGDNREGNSKREDVQDHLSNTIRRRKDTAIPQQRPRIPPYHCLDPYEAINRSKRRRRNEGIARERRKDQKQGEEVHMVWARCRNETAETKGGRVPTRSAGGHPREEKKPRTEDKELEHGEREGAPGEGLRGGTLAAAEHACTTPWSKVRGQELTVPAL